MPLKVHGRDILLFLVVLISFLRSDRAFAEASADYKRTFGTGSYVGNNLDLDMDLARGFNLGFTYNSFESDSSNGLTKTYMGRIGWSDPRRSIDLTGGLRIKIDDTTLTGKLTTSVYTQSSFVTLRRVFSTMSAPELQQGYPSQIVSIKINQDIASWLWVYGSYSNEQYKFGQTG